MSHATMPPGQYEMYRQHLRFYRHLDPSVEPHATCFGCPLETCPLKYYVRPCIFRQITEARDTGAVVELWQG